MFSTHCKVRSYFTYAGLTKVGDKTQLFKIAEPHTHLMV